MHGNFPILHSFIDWNIFHFLNYVTLFTLIFSIWGKGEVLPNKHMILADSWRYSKHCFTVVGWTSWRVLPLFFNSSVLASSFLKLTLLATLRHLSAWGLQRDFTHLWERESSWDRKPPGGWSIQTHCLGIPKHMWHGDASFSLDFRVIWLCFGPVCVGWGELCAPVAEWLLTWTFQNWNCNLSFTSGKFFLHHWSERATYIRERYFFVRTFR